MMSTKDNDSKKDQNNDLSNLKEDQSLSKQFPITFRTDTIPVIVINGVYYPSQKLRFKLNDPSISFRKDLIFRNIIYDHKFVLESFSEKYFGIVSKKSDTDDSFYMTGVLVKVIDQETFFTNLFNRNYIEFLVEGISRFKILKVLS